MTAASGHGLSADAIAAELDRILPKVAQPERRALIVACLARHRRAGQEQIEALLAQTPRDGGATVAAIAALTDTLVTAAFRASAQHLHSAAPGEAVQLSIVAVGGYGRAEMAPYSDVDLLFLVPAKVPARSAAVIESLLYILWDLKLKVGHATRSPAECLKLGRADMTIRTALLEHRLVCGDAGLAAGLAEQLRRRLFKGTGPAFIEAKLAERAERHHRQGGQRYVLEPNVKEGKGGLRDLQALYWIGKYIHGAASAADLVPLGLFSGDEFELFRRAEAFLWAVRCHLHLSAGRAVDQLTFDIQVEVAERMGYDDRAGRRAVEHFMQDYFRHATQVGELTGVFLTELESRHLYRNRGLARLLRRRIKVGAGYALRDNRLAIADPVAFLADKLNMLRIFQEALRTGLFLHPDAMRLIAANLERIDDEMRSDPGAVAIFLDLFLNHGNPEHELRRMNELGLLAAFLPEFEPIVAMMQFNVYHHYTVDEHIIQCVSVLAQIERRELVEELPIVSRILKDGVNRKIIYVAILLHDIGKGRPEDHSVLGAQIARRVAQRLRLTEVETETVEWLVRYHLLMSDIAQKRDLSDPRTLRDFAKAVKTRERLDLLTVLTVCDIRGVGPGTWNNWKAELLRRLYRETAEAMEAGLEVLNRERREDVATKSLRKLLPDWDLATFRAETARHYGPYWQGLPSETHVVFARLLQDLGASEIRIDIKPDPDRDATRACFALADHPGIFSRLAGALALSRANVVDARTYTSKDGFATAVFWVQDAEGHPYDEERIPRLKATIRRMLKGEVVGREAMKDRDKIARRERQFSFPTSVSYDNEGSDIYTIIEVDTRDRPALLYDLTRTLANNHIYIASAVIATYGAQVVDTFYVKDAFGLKLHARSRQEALERKLRQAIAEGAERARA